MIRARFRSARSLLKGTPIIKLMTNQETILAAGQQHIHAEFGLENPDATLASTVEDLDRTPTCQVVKAGAEFSSK